MPSANEIPADEKSLGSSELNPGSAVDKATIVSGANPICTAVRRRLPDERHSLTHDFSIGRQEGYVTVGLYEDGTPGEMFV
jgi:ribonucleoside-diphosphate reductase alpha chain